MFESLRNFDPKLRLTVVWPFLNVDQTQTASGKSLIRAPKVFRHHVKHTNYFYALTIVTAAVQSYLYGSDRFN